MILLDDNGKPAPLDKQNKRYHKVCVECGIDYISAGHNAMYCVECRIIRTKQRLMCKQHLPQYQKKRLTIEYIDGEGIIHHGLSYKELLKSKGLSVKPVPKHMPDFNKKADELIKRLDNKE